VSAPPRSFVGSCVVERERLSSTERIEIGGYVIARQGWGGAQREERGNRRQGRVSHAELPCSSEESDAVRLTLDTRKQESRNE